MNITKELRSNNSIIKKYDKKRLITIITFLNDILDFGIKDQSLKDLAIDIYFHLMDLNNEEQHQLYETMKKTCELEEENEW